MLLSTIGCKLSSLTLCMVLELPGTKCAARFVGGSMRVITFHSQDSPACHLHIISCCQVNLISDTNSENGNEHSPSLLRSQIRLQVIPTEAMRDKRAHFATLGLNKFLTDSHAYVRTCIDGPFIATASIKHHLVSYLSVSC